jgi:hypothetical protein
MVSERPDCRGNEAFASLPPSRPPYNGCLGDPGPGARPLRPSGAPEFVEQRLCLFEIGRAETLGEPVVDRRQKIASFGAATLVAADPSRAAGDGFSASWQFATRYDHGDPWNKGHLIGQTRPFALSRRMSGPFASDPSWKTLPPITARM